MSQLLQENFHSTTPEKASDFDEMMTETEDWADSLGFSKLPIVSIITPLYNTNEAHFTDCAHSVKGAMRSLVDVAEIEWLVQVDGGEAPAYLDKFPYANVETNQSNVGAAAARNAALARSTGEIIVSVDADDVIVDLRPVVTALIANPEIGWASGLVLELHDDNSMRSVGAPWSDEIVPVGAILDKWWKTGVYPFHAAGSFGMRASLLHQIGGWPPTFFSEDAELAVNLSEISTGWFSAHFIHLYRRHEAQQTAAPEWVATRHDKSVQLRTKLMGQRNTQLKEI